MERPCGTDYSWEPHSQRDEKTTTIPLHLPQIPNTPSPISIQYPRFSRSSYRSYPHREARHDGVNHRQLARKVDGLDKLQVRGTAQPELNLGTGPCNRLPPHTSPHCLLRCGSRMNVDQNFPKPPTPLHSSFRFKTSPSSSSPTSVRLAHEPGVYDTTVKRRLSKVEGKRIRECNERGSR